MSSNSASSGCPIYSSAAPSSSAASTTAALSSSGPLPTLSSQVSTYVQGQLFLDHGTYIGGINNKGDWQGFGIFTESTGTICVGAWREGRQEGEGILVFSNGKVRFVVWHQGKMRKETTVSISSLKPRIPPSNAFRAYLNPLLFHSSEEEADYRYEGSWKNGLPDGPGIKTFTDEERHTYTILGTCIQGKREGTFTTLYDGERVAALDYKNGIAIRYIQYTAFGFHLLDPPDDAAPRLCFLNGMEKPVRHGWGWTTVRKKGVEECDFFGQWIRGKREGAFTILHNNKVETCTYKNDRLVK